jgi:DNA-binding MarR family transcriptional regulator
VAQGRTELEALIAADVRAMTAGSEQIGHAFARSQEVTANDFRALLHITVAETAGAPLTAGDLRTRMGVSAAAITYLVERMIASGHVRRDVDEADRRRVKLRLSDHGTAVAREFFLPLAAHTSAALAPLSDDDLAAAHRVLTAVTAAMQARLAELAVTPC